MSLDAYQHATDTILAVLENGTVPWRHPLLGGGEHTMPKNLNTGKAYRGINLFLLGLAGWSAGYESPWWLTFRQAKSRGGHVKKGEKSTPIVFWKEHVVTDRKTGEPKKVPILRHYNVFSVEQCEGIEYPTPSVLGVPFEPLVAAEAIVAGYSEGPTVIHGPRQACYLSIADEVRIPKPERFVDGNAYYATLFHELAHSTGHSSRLDRGLNTNLAPFGSPVYAKEELVAEFAAAGMSAITGVTPAVIENAAAYISGWLTALRSDKRLAVQAAGAGQKAVDWIRGERQR